MQGCESGIETPGKGSVNQSGKEKPEEVAQLMHCQDLMKSNASEMLWLLE